MSLFKNIFKKKEQWVPFDLSFLVNDIHSHLIPGIDDGSKSLDDSIVLSKGLEELGYKKAITTPHIMSDFYRNTPSIIKNGLTEIEQPLKDNNINLDINVGAEYYIDFDFIKKIGKEELLTFGDNYILVEFSFVDTPRGINEAFFELQVNGYKPILAHPERYMYWHSDPKKLFELKDRDVLFQLNLLSLSGYYGKGAEIMGETLIKNSMIDWLGTDLHNQHQLQLLKNYKLKENIAQLVSDKTYLNQTL